MDSLQENQSIDYIYCFTYEDKNAVETNFQTPSRVVADTRISCNLNQRQRSSQQILDFADYLQMHSFRSALRRWDSPKSFSSDIPLWVELVNPKVFFDYFRDKFQGDDVLLLYDATHRTNTTSTNYTDIGNIDKFCSEQKWSCTSNGNVTGCEASVIILYDFNFFHYEQLTRAKTQLVVVTIDGKQRYFL